MAVACGSCHIGGSVVEFDRNGIRHAQRDMTMTFNADQNYVEEMYNEQGLPIHLEAGVETPGFAAAYAPWAYPAQMGGGFVTAEMISGMTGGAGNGWSTGMEGPGVPAGALMMPNVREMDCFFCHLEGFNNIISSVAVQMGYLNAAPSMSAGMLNMFSQTYVPGTYETYGTEFPGFGFPAKLSGAMLNRLKGEPLAENCRQCHTPTTMENFSSMFDEFLAAAPMTYDPLAPGASPLNGMVMPAYDLNAAFVADVSPQVIFNYTTFTFEYANGGGSAAGPYGLFPMAMDTNWSMLSGDVVVGGAKPSMSGPLYYASGVSATLDAEGNQQYASMLDQTGFAPGMSNQNTWKKSSIPFPRADFFKRGDIWDNSEQEVHYRLGCAGCHYNTNSTNADLNQCDPGRGRTRMGGVESGQSLNGGYTADNAFIPATTGIDTHDTVKRCQDCHITGQNVEGIAIDTFGAPNPTAAHTAAGLMANVTNALRLDAAGNKEAFTGNHMDVIDCSVCHIYKQSMAVRALDSTSGNRYPTMIGLQNDKGMMAMFTDPMDANSMSDQVAIGTFTQNMMGMGWTSDAVNMMLGMYNSGMDTPLGKLDFASQGDMARAMLQNPPVEWKPIYGWHDNTPKTVNGAVNPNWRMRIVPINFITAQMWDDSADGSVDMNNDNAEADGDIDPGAIKWDPPISRDMKVGMNFAPGPFATIPVGFGPPEMGYMSAFDFNTFAFTGAFQFVGAYGGNSIITTPAEMDAYKAFRGMIANPAVPGQEFDYANTELVFQGGNPFQVTHNVVATSKYVRGTSCADCHAPGAGFFSGDYDMTGTAVPASATYKVEGPMADMLSGALGAPATIEIASNMMMRPLVDYEVVTRATDLRTGSEAKAKATGAVLDVEFDVLGCWDGTTTSNGTHVEGFTEIAYHHLADAVAANACNGVGDGDIYKMTTDLSRSAFMYPEMDEAALATKIGTLEAIGATVSTPESLAAQYGVGVAPTADIASINGVTETSSVVTVGDITVVADTTNAAPASQYSWRIYKNNVDAPLTATGATPAAITLPAAGTYSVELRVTNIDGAIATDMYHVVALAEERNNGLVAFSGVSPTGASVILTDPTAVTDVNGDALVYDTVKVFWGDGSFDIFSVADGDIVDAGDGTAASGDQTFGPHAYSALGDYRVDVLFYNTSGATNYIVDRWVDDLTYTE